MTTPAAPAIKLQREVPTFVSPSLDRRHRDRRHNRPGGRRSGDVPAPEGQVRAASDGGAAASDGALDVDLISSEHLLWLLRHR